MECGYILDYGHGNRRRQGTWIEGDPELTFFGGTRIYGKRQIKVQTFRCLSCGYLESYAR